MESEGVSLVVSKKCGPAKVVYLAGDDERQDGSCLETYQEIEEPAGGGKTEQVVEVEVAEDEDEHVRVQCHGGTGMC